MAETTGRVRRVLALAVAALAVVAISGYAVGAPTDTVQQAAWCANRAAGAVVLGDSGTTGYGTTGYLDGTQGGDEYWQPTYSGWVSALMRVWPEAPWYVASRNGAMTSDYLPGGRFPRTVNAVSEIQARQPSLVIIELGGNDYVIDRTPSAYRANLEQITANVKAARPGVTVVYVTMWDFKFKIDNADPNYTFGSYANAMRDVAAAQGATWIDLRKDMHPAYVHEETALYYADEFGPDAGIHTRDAGSWVQRAVMRHRLSCVDGVLPVG